MIEACLNLLNAIPNKRVRDRESEWTLPLVFECGEEEKQSRNGDVESSAHKHNGRPIHQAYVAAPALGFRARIRSSPHSPGTPLLPPLLSL
jgi:hypothetical protein